jgi:hypothetical protein
VIAHILGRFEIVPPEGQFNGITGFP